LLATLLLATELFLLNKIKKLVWQQDDLPMPASSLIVLGQCDRNRSGVQFEQCKITPAFLVKVSHEKRYCCEKSAKLKVE